MVASSSCPDYDNCYGKASFESSGSIAGFSSSSSSSHKNHHVLGGNDNSGKLSYSSSSTDTTSRNSLEKGLPTLDSTTMPTIISKPHKAHDGAWASIQSLKSKEGSLGIAHFKLLCRVGHGDIGRVFLAQLRGTRCFFAMKVMDREALTQRKKVQRMYREREILEFVDHPFLPTLYAHFEAEQFSCLVMDYCSGGDLHAMRQKYPGRRFAIKAARFYAAEVLLALEYLHMLGIVYRDLKPENVLVRDDGHIMLTDFDLSFKCDVQPKLVKCPLSSSSSSSSGRFNLLRSFSMSSSMSSTSTLPDHMQQCSVNCMLPSACAIHPFLSCLPLSANMTGKAEQAHKKHQKHRLSLLFWKQLARIKPKLEPAELGDQVRLQTPKCVAESCEAKHGKKQGADGNACEDGKNIETLKTAKLAGISKRTIQEDVEFLNTEEFRAAPEAESATIEDLMGGLELVAEPTQARSMSFVGTHEYLAPEMIAGHGHGNALDWWTFGIFLFELIYGRTPFKGSCNEQTLLNIIKQELRFPEWGHVHVGEHAKSLIEGLLVKDPSKRFGSLKGAAEIKQHPFFRGVNWALIRSTQPPEVPKRKATSSYHHYNHHQQQQDDAEKRNVFIVNRAAHKPLSHFDYF